jgi:hypothetical protein
VMREGRVQRGIIRPVNETLIRGNLAASQF